MKNLSKFLLAAVLCFCILPTGVALSAQEQEILEKTAYPVTADVLLDGSITIINTYQIEGEYYFNLRDLANALAQSPAFTHAFQIGWNAEKSTVDLSVSIAGKAYEPVGGENQKKTGSITKAVPASFSPNIHVSTTSYYPQSGDLFLIDGSAYIKAGALRVLNISSDYYEAADTILMNTGNSGGSLSHISKPIVKKPGWKQIVQDSPFQLGEETLIYEIPQLSYGTYPNLDGSTVAVPMAVEFMWQHLGEISHPDSFIDFSTTHTAYTNLIGSTRQIGNSGLNHRYLTEINGNIINDTAYMDPEAGIDLIIATAPSEEELAVAKSNNVELVIKPVCWDAFVFITHVSNPVDSLTVEEIQKIYTGEITNWQAVGGPDAPIIAYQREKNSGSQTAMEEMVMASLDIISPPENEILRIYGMGDLVDIVAEYENNAYSLGYSYKYYIDNLYTDPNIKVLAIDGVSPDKEGILSGAYPYTANYYGVIRSKDQNSVGGKFLEWMLSDEGQKCIEQAGYIPLR